MTTLRFSLILGIVFFLICFYFIYCIGLVGIEYRELKQNRSNELSFYLDEIDENCGSTQIAKKYGDKENWYVFRIVEGPGKDSYEYVPLEECLKERLDHK